MSEPSSTLDDAQLDSAVELLESLTAESSPSTDAAGLARFAERLAGELSARRWSARIESAAGGDGRALPLLVADSPPSTAAPSAPLLLLGHIDTVLPASPPERTSVILRATGSIDMKGGIAVLLAALDLLSARGLPSPEGCRLVLVPDEEVAGAISRRATAEHGARARAVWVLEPGESDGDGGETIVVGRRGLACFALELRGRAAHSGLDFARGRSATAAAARWCAAAGDLSDPVAGPTVNVARLVGGDREFVENLAAQGGLLGGDARLNVVADRAVIEGEYRFRRAAQGVETRARLEALAARERDASEVEIDLRFFGDVPAVEPTTERLVYAERASRLAARRGWQLGAETDRGGVSFPNFLPPGIEVPILDGLGPVGGGMHTRSEFVDLVSFGRRIALLADLLAEESAAQR